MVLHNAESASDDSPMQGSRQARSQHKVPARCRNAITHEEGREGREGESWKAGTQHPDEPTHKWLQYSTAAAKGIYETLK